MFELWLGAHLGFEEGVWSWGIVLGICLGLVDWVVVGEVVVEGRWECLVFDWCFRVFCSSGECEDKYSQDSYILVIC